jgi:hypothetical protein
MKADSIMWIVVGVVAIGTLFYLAQTSPVQAELAQIKASASTDVAGINAASSITNTLVSALSS